MDLQPHLLREHQLEIRVRYSETDAMGRVHHSNFINYFELGRTEMMRAAGLPYTDFEKLGVLMVIKELNVQYHLAARFDDLLKLRTTTIRAKGARIVHDYQLTRGEDLIATGRSVVATVHPDGSVARLPKFLQLDEQSNE
ncbi:MAG: thioesterase family protein [Pirellulales bacterium]